MQTPRSYLSEIGRRGGIKSRRTLDAQTARRMVASREARRAARLAHGTARLAGTPIDTDATSQAMQDELLRRTPAAEKLAMVVRLSRMVDELSVAGLRSRHPNANPGTITRLRADLRLGRELAGIVYGPRRDHG